MEFGLIRPQVALIIRGSLVRARQDPLEIKGLYMVYSLFLWGFENLPNNLPNISKSGFIYMSAYLCFENGKELVECPCVKGSLQFKITKLDPTKTGNHPLSTAKKLVTEV